MSSNNNKNGSSVKLKNTEGFNLLDDRNNDWLAKQLNEEKKSKQLISEMFQLKQEHLNNCDAEFIKRFHASNCDAQAIDDGNYKGTK
ncbi:MAG: hypothetical protein K6E98_06670 [Lachnospiraceae bacterium]|nr:hypothetical protein [Lachnospiraceae bacterium]